LKIRLFSVGKPRDPALIALHDRYADRMTHLGVRYESAWVPETRPGPRFSDDHVRERDARTLLERLHSTKTGSPGTTVALDPGGAAMTSEILAKRLESWLTPQLTLIIGGPLGLHANALAAADSSWSLSKLTFPHEMVRVLVAEQMYRALTILRNTPYHK
jgi:23S rRNA (pseudouridine1915-N3)-methyltransferase